MTKKAAWIIIPCAQCGTEVARTAYMIKVSKTKLFFCKPECHDTHRKGVSIHTAGGFSKGNIPWNKGLKGIHLSPATEFKPGHKYANVPDPIGTLSLRDHPRDGERRYIKIAHPDEWVWYSRYLWEQENGPVPEGMVVYHEDNDWLNDDPSNLILITRKQLLLRNFGRI